MTQTFRTTVGTDVLVTVKPDTAAAWRKVHGILTSLDRLAIDAHHTSVGDDWRIQLRVGKVTVTATPAPLTPPDAPPSAADSPSAALEGPSEPRTPPPT